MHGLRPRGTEGVQRSFWNTTAESPTGDGQGEEDGGHLGGARGKACLIDTCIAGNGIKYCTAGFNNQEAILYAPVYSRPPDHL